MRERSNELPSAAFKSNLILFLLIVSPPLLAVDCNEIDITINSQSDVDTFQGHYGGGSICDRVIGNLRIRNVSNLGNLDGLKHLREIGGNLEIENNDSGSASNASNSLVNISGLNELGSVGGHFYLDNNSQLSECRWVAELLGWPDGQTGNTAKQAVFANSQGCNSIAEIYADATAVMGDKSNQENTYQGMWWNSSESGWGINFEHQADLIFVAWYTYDDTGEPWWVTGLLEKAATGVYSGELYTTTGPPFYSTPFDSSAVVTEVIGSMTASFSDSGHGMIDYVLDGVSQTKQIERFIFAQGPVVVQEREYNDEREYATVFRLGETVTGSLSNSVDIDWFAVDVQTGGMVEANFDVSTIASSPSFWNVSWYDPNMQIMSGRNIAAPLSFSYQFPAITAGTYYLRVQATEATVYSGGPYKVSLKATP